MLYLSSLLGSTVLDPTNQSLGHLRDMVIQSGRTYPHLSAIVICGKLDKREQYISFEDVELLGKGIVTLKHRLDQLTPYEVKGDDIRLKSMVLDRQVVDTEGMKVVRANDVMLGQVKGKLSVLSIDISLKGILRRMKLGWIPWIERMNSRVVPWVEISLVESGSSQLQLRTTHSALEHLHPADIANLVEELNAKRGAALMANLPADVAAEVLEEVGDEETLAIIEHLGYKKASKILAAMSHDQVADIMDDLPEEKALKLLADLEPQEGQKILELITYKDEEAGGMMTMDYFFASPGESVATVKKRLQDTHDEIPSVLYIYVIDESGKLVGVLSLRTLALAKNSEKMAELMTTNVFSVRANAGIKEIATYLTKYNLYSVAVVDEEDLLLGIIMVDDVMRELFPEA